MVYEMEPLALARQMSHLFYSKNVQMTKIKRNVGNDTVVETGR